VSFSIFHPQAEPWSVFIPGRRAGCFDQWSNLPAVSREVPLFPRVLGSVVLLVPLLSVNRFVLAFSSCLVVLFFFFFFGSHLLQQLAVPQLQSGRPLSVVNSVLVRRFRSSYTDSAEGGPPSLDCAGLSFNRDLVWQTRSKFESESDYPRFFPPPVALISSPRGGTPSEVPSLDPPPPR